MTDRLDDEDVAQPADDGLASDFAPVHLLGQQVQGGTERGATSGADMDHRRKSVQQSAGAGVLDAQATADQLRERPVASVPQNGVVLGLLVVRQVGDQRVFGRSSGFDPVTCPMRHEREIAGLEHAAGVSDDQFAAPRRDGVEPHAASHRRHGPTPRLVQVGGAIEDPGDRDVAQRIGDGWHRLGIRDHAHHRVRAPAPSPVLWTICT